MKRVLATALLLAASAAVAGLAAEGAVRWLRPGFVAGPAGEGAAYWAHDPELGWSLAPGSSGRFTSPEFEHDVSINSMGFRDREREAARPASIRARIAVLGDSFTWGHGVGDAEIFTVLLEALLPGVEVWNLGVSAYSTDQELLLLRRHLAPVAPDLVLVMVSRNDFAGNASQGWEAYPKPRFVQEGDSLRLVNVPVPHPRRGGRTVTWLRRHSALVNGLLWTLGADGPGLEEPLMSRPERVRLTLRILDLMDEEAREAGAALAVGLVPSVAHVYYGEVPEVERRKYDPVRDWAADREVPLIDLVPGFRRVFDRTGGHFHYARDKHWNREGHRLAAEEMAPLLDRILSDLAS